MQSRQAVWLAILLMNDAMLFAAHCLWYAALDGTSKAPARVRKVRMWMLAVVQPHSNASLPEDLDKIVGHRMQGQCMRLSPTTTGMCWWATTAVC